MPPACLNKSRQAAETTLAQAKQAVDQYLQQATNLQEKVESSVQRRRQAHVI